MVLGGLEEGVTPLEWAYAFSTIANDGDRVSGTLAPRPGDSPVAYTEVTDGSGKLIKGGDNDSIRTQALPEDVAQEAKSILHSVVTSGTGVQADVGDDSQWGKTGTTENNGDAWFCGAIEEVTACVWVGYADTTTPMLTEYSGGPVDGGTFPALIWAGVVNAWKDIAADRAADRKAEEDARKSESDDEGDEPAESSSPAPEETYVPPTEPEPEPEAPESAPAPEAPEATPEPAPESGGGGGITAG
jgi:penicillin-binding protein 1A